MGIAARIIAFACMNVSHCARCLLVLLLIGGIPLRVRAQTDANGATALAPPLTPGPAADSNSAVKSSAAIAQSIEQPCASGFVIRCKLSKLSQLRTNLECGCEEKNPATKCKYHLLRKRFGLGARFGEGKPCLETISEGCKRDNTCEGFPDFKEYDFVTGEATALDSLCRPYSKPMMIAEICDFQDVTPLHTPISLVWEELTAILPPVTVCQFPLNHIESHQWYTWKASASRPLLVYQPELETPIESPFQLFGNWTFGDNKLASVMNRTSLTHGREQPLWEHGYQALAVMDLNMDKKISGQELKPLSLWFDENQDCVAQAQEVKRLAEVGVITLYYHPDRADTVSYDIFASQGYERIINGKVVVRPSVDWFAEKFNSKLEALSVLSARAQIELSQSASNKMVAPKRVDEESGKALAYSRLHGKLNTPAPSKRLSISGVWHWVIEGETERVHMPTNAFGVITFRENGENIDGYSHLEMALEPNQNAVKSIVSTIRVRGKRVISGDRKLTISFEASDEHSKTKSSAYLSKDGMTLFGISNAEIYSVTAKTPRTTIRYTWIAHRL